MSSIETPAVPETDVTPAEPAPSKTPAWVLALATVALMGLFCLGAVELLLRVVPGEWSSAFFHVYDPKVGTWHFPSYEGDWIRTDVRVEGIRGTRLDGGCR